MDQYNGSTMELMPNGGRQSTASHNDVNLSIAQVRMSSVSMSGEDRERFSDPSAYVDYVLVVERKHRGNRTFRAKFIEALKAEPNHFEVEISDSSYSTGSENGDVFIKLHAPFETLCKEAEIIRMNMLLKKELSLEERRQPSILSRGMNALFGTENAPLTSFAAPFKSDKLHLYKGSDNKDTFFAPAKRSLLVYTILSNLDFKDESDMWHRGIDTAIEMGLFSAAYPLHDGMLNPDEVRVEPNGILASESRRFLADNWAGYGSMFKLQPIDHIRDYFGEKIGIYFVWLGFYTSWLIVPTLFGLLVFIYGLGKYQNFKPALEVCTSNITVCALCETCDKWQLSTACSRYKMAFIFDNDLTLPFAVIMSLWATLFLEFWKRRNARLAHDWNVMGFEKQEIARPQYKGVVPVKDEATGTVTYVYPFHMRLMKLTGSLSIIFLMIGVVIVLVIGVIAYRLAVAASIYKKNPGTALGTNAGLITSVTAALLNLICIIVLNQIYRRVATSLNKWENHRTQTQYEDHLSFKIFLFEFVNSYASIFYIAFFKGRFSGRPGDDNTLFGYRLERCPEYGCMLELTIQLGIVMVGKQAFGNIMEVAVPFLKEKFQNKAKNRHFAKTQWEQDQLLLNPDPLFSEYLEMILQYGFITLFVAAFPLAPAFALLNNIVEIRLDARKVLRQSRRVPALQAEDIGEFAAISTTKPHFARCIHKRRYM
eukprot:Opistho-2@31530